MTTRISRRFAHEVSRGFVLASGAALLCVLPTRASAQFDVWYHKYDAIRPTLSRLPGAGVQVPLLMVGEPGRKLPVIQAMVNGRGPFRFGIATGIHDVAVTPALARKLRLHSTDKDGRSNTYHLDSLNIGKLGFDNFPVTELAAAQEGVDGLLGGPLFNDVILTLDYARRKARFDPGALPPVNGKDIVEMRYVHDGDYIGVPVTIGTRSLTAIIDTRATGSLGLTPEAAKPFPLGAVRRGRSAARAPAAAARPFDARLGADLRIGEFTIREPFVHVRPLAPGLPTEPIVGTMLLQHFVVSIDENHGRVRFSHRGPATFATEDPRNVGGAYCDFTSTPASCRPE